MKKASIINNIKQLGLATLPPNSSLLLYGSRARGDMNEGSDWDLHILLDKPKLVADDYDVAYPFRELGWEMCEEISPRIYPKQQWDKWTFLPFRKNVERDKIVLI